MIIIYVYEVGLMLKSKPFWFLLILVILILLGDIFSVNARLDNLFNINMLGAVATGLITLCAMWFIDERQQKRWVNEEFKKEYYQDCKSLESSIDKVFGDSGSFNFFTDDLVLNHQGVFAPFEDLLNSLAMDIYMLKKCLDDYQEKYNISNEEYKGFSQFVEYIGALEGLYIMSGEDKREELRKKLQESCEDFLGKDAVQGDIDKEALLHTQCYLINREAMALKNKVRRIVEFKGK